MKTLRHYTLLTSAIALLASMNSVASETTIAVTAENFSHAETARNYRNWAAQGANKGFVIMPGLPPRGKAAATVQMNDDTLYGAAIVEAVDGKVTFSIPNTNNYLAVQVVTERGHGQHYVVEDGQYKHIKVNIKSKWVLEQQVIMFKLKVKQIYQTIGHT